MENFLASTGTISVEMKLTVMLDQLWAVSLCRNFYNFLIKDKTLGRN